MSETTTEAVQDNAQEVATDSQSQVSESSPEVGSLIAESKKYRTRAQSAEEKLAKLEKQIQLEKENKMAEPRTHSTQTSPSNL